MFPNEPIAKTDIFRQLDSWASGEQQPPSSALFLSSTKWIRWMTSQPTRARVWKQKFSEDERICSQESNLFIKGEETRTSPVQTSNLHEKWFMSRGFQHVRSSRYQAPLPHDLIHHDRKIQKDACLGASPDQTLKIRINWTVQILQPSRFPPPTSLFQFLFQQSQEQGHL